METTIKELHDYQWSSTMRNSNWFWTFVYKKRRYNVGAYIPFLDEYEIHTVKGDITKTVKGSTIAEKPKLEYYE